MKRVFSSHNEVCKVWASRNQDEGRAGNISFMGDTIYSYGWFEMATFIDDKTVLVTTDRYSSSTSNHISTAAYHAAKAHKVLRVKSIKPDHDVNCKDFQGRICRAVEVFCNSLRHPQWHLDHYHELVEQYRKYTKYFELKLPIFVGYELNKQKADERIAEIKQRNWNNVFIPKWLFYKKVLAPKDLVRIKNAQVRAEFVKKVGIDRIIFELGEIVDTVGNYQLVILDLQDGRKRPFLKMQNPSLPELWHVEGVHPACKTVADALQYRRYGNEVLGGHSWRPNDPENEIRIPEDVENWKPEILT